MSLSAYSAFKTLIKYENHEDFSNLHAWLSLFFENDRKMQQITIRLGGTRMIDKAKFLAQILAFVGVVGLATPVFAEGDEAAAEEAVEAIPGPEVTIEAFNASIIQAIETSEEEGFAVRHEIMKNAVGEAFDMPVLARRTVRRTVWVGWSKEQKQEYIDTLQDFQAAILADRFKLGADVSFAIDGVEDKRKKTKLVLTRIIRPDDEDVKLNYLTVRRGDHWRIVDVYLNSTISEVALRRSEYSAIVSEKGYDGLLEALNSQINDLIEANASAEVNTEVENSADTEAD